MNYGELWALSHDLVCQRFWRLKLLFVNETCQSWAPLTKWLIDFLNAYFRYGHI